LVQQISVPEAYLNPTPLMEIACFKIRINIGRAIVITYIEQIGAKLTPAEKFLEIGLMVSNCRRKKGE